MNSYSLLFILNLISRIGMSLGVIGWMLIILQQPFSNVMFVFGAVIAVIFYWIKTVLKSKNTLKYYLKPVYVTFIYASGIITVLDLELPHYLHYTLLVLFYISLLVFLILLAQKLLVKNTRKISILFLLSFILISLSFLFKFSHWPGATALLISGSVLIILWLLLEPFLNRKINNDLIAS